MKRERVYISGQMSGIKDYNFPAFNQREQEIIDHRPDLEAVNPARMLTVPSFEWKDYIIRDLKVLSSCDRIESLGDYEKSKGARFEHAYFNSTDDLYTNEMDEYHQLVNQAENKIKVLLVSGKKRSGKDTFSDFLVKDSAFRRYAFADVMKEVASLIFGWDEEYLNGDLKELMDAEFGISPRHFLQYFGTNLMQHKLCELSPTFEGVTGRAIWAKRAVNWIRKQRMEVRDFRDIIISDFRFPHEYTTLAESLDKDIYDVQTVQIFNPTLKISDSHSSENALDDFKFDHVLYNNGTNIEEFHEIAKVFQGNYLKS